MQTGTSQVRFTQKVKDFMIDLTRVRDKDGHEHLVYMAATPRHLARQFLPEATDVRCIVHLTRDVDVFFWNVFEPGPARVMDRQKRRKTAMADMKISVADMEPEQLLERAEEFYLAQSGQFSDPYQRTDGRKEPLGFESGSWDDLTTGITSLFHGFPAIFERVPEVRVHVYSKFDNIPANFNLHLFWAGRFWQTGDYFRRLIAQVVRENVPVGFRYVNPNPFEMLVRRSHFKKGPIIVPVTITSPSSREFHEAWADIRSRFAKYNLHLHPQMFSRLLIYPQPEVVQSADRGSELDLAW